MDQPVEDLAPASDEIRGRLIEEIKVQGVEIVRTDHDASSPNPRSPDQVIVYSTDRRAARGLGHPLVFTVRCPDPTAWARIEEVMDRARFLRFGPVGPDGARAYISLDRAWFVVPVNPNARMAVEMTGKAVLGWIAKS